MVFIIWHLRKIIRQGMVVSEKRIRKRRLDLPHVQCADQATSFPSFVPSWENNKNPFRVDTKKDKIQQKRLVWGI